MNAPIPKELLQRKAHLADAFRAEAPRLGITVEEADEAFRLVPLSVKESPTFTWILSPEWRYSFGDPFTLGGTPVAIGTPQAPAVGQLVRAIRVASRALTPEQLVQWLGQLSIPGKHADALVEMLAVANVPGSTVPVYEPPGMAVGSKRIDWFIPGGARGVLFEVKNRLGQLADELERLRPHMEAGLPGIPGEPRTDFDALFRSTLEKFPPVNQAPHIQGVLLFPGMKLPQVELTQFFKERLAPQLHFIALSTDGITVHLEAQSEPLAQAVLKALGWVLGADLLFQSAKGAGAYPSNVSPPM